MKKKEWNQILKLRPESGYRFPMPARLIGRNIGPMSVRYPARQALVTLFPGIHLPQSLRCSTLVDGWDNNDRVVYIWEPSFPPRLQTDVRIRYSKLPAPSSNISIHLSLWFILAQNQFSARYPLRKRHPRGLVTRHLEMEVITKVTFPTRRIFFLYLPPYSSAFCLFSQTDGEDFNWRRG